MSFRDAIQQVNLLVFDLRRTLVTTIEASQTQINLVLYAVAGLLGSLTVVKVFPILIAVVYDDTTWTGPRKNIILRSDVDGGSPQFVQTLVRVSSFESLVYDVCCTFDRQRRDVERLVQRPKGENVIPLYIQDWWTMPPLSTTYEGVIHDGDMIGVVWRPGHAPADHLTTYDFQCLRRDLRFWKRTRLFVYMVILTAIVYGGSVYSKRHEQRQYIRISVPASFVVVSDVGSCQLKFKYRANQLERWQVIDFVLKREGDPKFEYELTQRSPVSAEAAANKDKSLPLMQQMQQTLLSWRAFLQGNTDDVRDVELTVNLADQRSLVNQVRQSARKWPDELDKYYLQASCWQSGLQGGNAISERTASFYFRPPKLRVLQPTAGLEHNPDRELQVVWRHDVRPHAPLEERWAVSISGKPMWSFHLWPSDAPGDSGPVEEPAAMGAVSTLTVRFCADHVRRKLPFGIFSMSRTVSAYIMVERMVRAEGTSLWKVAEREYSASFVLKYLPHSDVNDLQSGQAAEESTGRELIPESTSPSCIPSAVPARAPRPASCIPSAVPPRMGAKSSHE